MPAGRDHGWWPYLVPYGGLLALLTIGARLPDAALPVMLALNALVPGLLVLVWWRRGRYPELAGYRPGATVLLDVAVGLGIAALWMAPYLAFPQLPRDAPFHPDAAGASARPLLLAMRLVGFAGVTPVVEELFVRSFLHRYAEVWAEGGDFRKRRVGVYDRRAFLVTVVWFTLSHRPWEYLVALPTGVIFNLWLYRRRHLGAVVVAHAVANAAIFAFVVAGPPGNWAFL